MGWPDIHWPARDPGWAGGSHWAICFDNLMISLFRQLCDTLCPVVRSRSLPMEGGPAVAGLAYSTPCLWPAIMVDATFSLMLFVDWHRRIAVSHHPHLPALARSVALTFQGLIRQHAFHVGWVWLHGSCTSPARGNRHCLVATPLNVCYVMLCYVFHAIATDGGVGGVHLDHGLCFGWIHSCFGIGTAWLVVCGNYYIS